MPDDAYECALDIVRRVLRVDTWTCARTSSPWGRRPGHDADRRPRRAGVRGAGVPDGRLRRGRHRCLRPAGRRAGSRVCRRTAAGLRFPHGPGTAPPDPPAGP
ncbi:hypothetical protein NKH77_01115 [Streptomyces sp. M19]